MDYPRRVSEKVLHNAFSRTILHAAHPPRGQGTEFMLKAVLFDIDNTLILYDEYRFFTHYLPLVTGYFDDLIAPGEFPAKLITSTREMMRNDGSRLNVDLFLDAFSRGIEQHRESIWPRFMAFYDSEFEAFNSLVVAPEGVREVFKRLQGLDLVLVLASNPVWPESVQLRRAAWAGIGDVKFSFVTHISNMSFCKPDENYYREICPAIGLPPTSCLMVGNDPVNDMVAGATGMKTYLTSDWEAIDQSTFALSRKIREGRARETSRCDYSGPIAGLPDAIEELMKPEIKTGTH
jgi:putative hydrolase of the HAD superfamily